MNLISPRAVDSDAAPAMNDRSPGAATSTSDEVATARQRSAALMGLWLFLFCSRVAAQGVQLFADLPFLPPFEAWHSALLPYPVLVACQLVLIVVLASAWLRARSGRWVPSRVVGKRCLLLGSLYFSLMALRLVLGLTILGDVRWFTSHLPTLFHLVLASFVLTLARYHLSEPRPAQ